MNEKVERFFDWVETDTGRRTVIGAVVGIIVLAILIWFFGSGATSAAREDLRRAGRKVTYYCPACKSSGRTTVSVDRNNPSEIPSPFKCPNCGEKQAVLGLRCVNCREIFPKPPAGQRLYYCLHCGQKYDLRLGGDDGPLRRPE